MTKDKKTDIYGFYLMIILMDSLSTNIFIDLHKNMGNLSGYDNNISEYMIEYYSYFISNGGITNFKSTFDDIYTRTPLLLRQISDHALKADFNEIIHLGPILKSVMINNEIRGYSEEISLNEIKKIEDDMNYVGYKNQNMSPSICGHSMMLGLIFNSKDQIDLLIKNAVKFAKLTHYNNIGILSAIVSAYFVSLAVQKIDIIYWIDMMFDLINSESVKKYLDLDNNENMIGYVYFLNMWNKYRDFRYEDNKIKKSKSDDNLVYKVKFYSNFVMNPEKNLPGDDAVNCLIISYDTLLFANGDFEKMIYYSVLIPGTQIYTGIYVGGLYSILHGYKTVPKKIIKNFLTEDQIEENLILEKKMKKKFKII